MSPAGSRRWVEAARPRTLPAAVAPVAVGTAAASLGGPVDPWRALAALVVALAVQVGVNYANDYFDGVRGIDTPDRVGPRRAVATGLVSARGMRVAMLCAFSVAGVAGLWLAAVAGWELLAVGALCFLAAVGYSGGPRPYASAGLGELFVFVFFGLVATVGSAYVQREAVLGVAVLAAVPVGLLATAILVVNNVRDVTTDAAAGKRTLAVRLGPRRTRTLYRWLVLAPFAFLPLLALAVSSALPFLALLAAVPASRAAVLVSRTEDPVLLVRALGATAGVQLLFGLLLAVALWLA